MKSLMIGLFRSLDHSYQIMLLQLKGAMSTVTGLIRKERYKANIITIFGSTCVAFAKMSSIYAEKGSSI